MTEDNNNYYEDDSEDDYISCALCGCIIGEEVGFGEKIAPDEIWCDNCMGK